MDQVAPAWAWEKELSLGLRLVGQVWKAKGRVKRGQSREGVWEGLLWGVLLSRREVVGLPDHGLSWGLSTLCAQHPGPMSWGLCKLAPQACMA